MNAEFVLLDTCAPENFNHYVETPSTRSKFELRIDQFGRTIEKTTFYKGSKILGFFSRDHGGYRYYLRK